MSESWLEVGDTELDAGEIRRRVEERMASRPPGDESAGCEDLALDFDAPDATRDTVSCWLQDCDIVPAHYEIDWRVPVVGRIHAAIRRVIHAEVRRFVLPALEKQGHLNRAMLQALEELEEENARLRRELEQMRGRLRSQAPDAGQDQEHDG
jgi:hypothetical protein